MFASLLVPLHMELTESSSQPILADEVQTFKALITIHKVLQEGHPIVLKEAQANVGWLESLRRGVVNGEGVRGMPNNWNKRKSRD